MKRSEAKRILGIQGSATEQELREAYNNAAGQATPEDRGLMKQAYLRLLPENISKSTQEYLGPCRTHAEFVRREREKWREIHEFLKRHGFRHEEDYLYACEGDIEDIDAKDFCLYLETFPFHYGNYPERAAHCAARAIEIFRQRPDFLDSEAYGDFYTPVSSLLGGLSRHLHVVPMELLEAALAENGKGVTDSDAYRHLRQLVQSADYREEYAYLYAKVAQVVQLVIEAKPDLLYYHPAASGAVRPIRSNLVGDIAALCRKHVNLPEMQALYGVMLKLVDGETPEALPPLPRAPEPQERRGLLSGFLRAFH